MAKTCGWAASGQVLREYLVVATRPAEVNGLGLSVPDALANVDEFARHLDLYDETVAVSTRLRQLALDHDLRGKRLHDANIVATMSVHGISTSAYAERKRLCPIRGYCNRCHS